MRKVNCLKFSLLGIFLFFLLSNCSLMMNKKGLQKAVFYHELKISFNDTTALIDTVVENIFSYKNWDLYYFKIVKIDTVKKHSFYRSNIYYVVDNKHNSVLKFDTLSDNPNFKKIEFKKFLSESHLLTTYISSDTINNKRKILKNNRSETILNVYSLEYKPQSVMIYLSKRKRKMKATLCPYYDSIYNKKAYKALCNNKYYSEDNNFFDFYVYDKISKQSFTLKERNIILSFFNRLDTTMFK